jgi:PAS domain S-box-containing protein
LHSELVTWMRRSDGRFAQARNQEYRVAVGVALGLVIFAIDTFTTLASAVAVLYVVVIVLAGDLGSRTIVRLTAAVCAALTLIGFTYSHGIDAESQSALRLLFSLAANLVTTILLLKNVGDRTILEAQARMLEMTGDAIFLRDRDGRIIHWNRGAELLYGWTQDEAVGQASETLIEASFPRSRAEAEAALEATGQWEGELKVRTKAGRELDVFSRWRLQRDMRGAAPTILETAVDISDRKAAEAALRASEHRYRTIFETIAVAVWDSDLREVKGTLDALRDRGVTNLIKYAAANPGFVSRMRAAVHITNANQMAFKLLAVPSKEPFFTRLDEFLPDTDGQFIHFLAAIFDGQTAFQSETVVRTRDGRFIPILVMLSLSPDGEGFERIPVSIIDMTERHEFQEALESSRQELEQASRAAMLGEISASIAHEVNQPLSAIITFVQAGMRWISRSPPDIDEAQSALQDAVTATEHAAQVVKRVRLLLGKAKSESTELAIDTLIGDAVRMKIKELTNEGVRLSLALGAPSAIIQGDKVLLQQAFLNIISNAMQAMDTTLVDTRSLLIESEMDDANILIRFTDSGAGLGSSSPESLFKPFNTTKPNGMGLGLAMCRSIVMAHNGTISIRARTSGRGAVVDIRLPLALEARQRLSVPA